MKRNLTFIVLAALLTFSGCNRANHPAGFSPGPSSVPVKDAAKATEEVPLHAVWEYKETLTARGQDLNDQGILIESLSGEHRFAQHNADYTFNPASVMKLATSLVALRRFQPDHRFRTNFLADGRLDTAQRKLEGDLVVEGGHDPKFSLADAQKVATELSRLGVSRVTGALRVAGPFYYYARGYTSNLSRETSASKLRKVLQGAGIKIDGETVFGEKSGALLLSHYSDQLDHILLYQNAYSSNAVAEVLGEAVGGPQVIQEFLIKELNLEQSDVYVGRASGLDFNRITPRASLKVLRALITELEKYSLHPEDVLPVAGIDSGTLRARLSREDVRGAVLAKTGTLVSMDKGVSTLVGIAYTKAHGPLLFAIFNSDGNVNAYRRLQDQFVEKIIAEQGGAVPVSRQQDALAEDPGDSINQVLFKDKPRPTTEGSTD